MTTTTKQPETETEWASFLAASLRREFQLRNDNEQAMRSLALAGKCLSEDLFDKELKKLRSVVRDYSGRASKNICDEFLRREACTASLGDSSVEDFLVYWSRFLRMWRKRSGELQKALDKWTDLHVGDDGFHDLCESLVLTGETVVQEILTGRISSYAELMRKLTSERDTQEILQFLTGENYWQSYLREMLKEKSGILMRDP
jgi:hypothetical protein